MKSQAASNTAKYFFSCKFTCTNKLMMNKYFSLLLLIAISLNSCKKSSDAGAVVTPPTSTELPAGAKDGVVRDRGRTDNRRDRNRSQPDGEWWRDIDLRGWHIGI
ncbi:MAG: hypothetical protein ABIW38_04545 [Ferruginibacter sp.]